MKRKIIYITALLIVLLVVLFSLIFYFFLMPKKHQSLIRPAIVAGAFYPKDKEILSQTIENFLNSAKLPPLKGKPRILIVPHAGYEFSGAVAGYGFKAIQGQNFKKAVIIGPSHQAYFSGFAISKADIWQTPLGEIEIDDELRQKLIQEDNSIFISENPHSYEHCLEVEVPFLQKINPDIEILPIIIGPNNPQPEILAKALSKHLDSSTILIISSDLSHYPPYEIANEKDMEIIESILEKDLTKFSKLVQETDESVNLFTRACGEEAIKVALILSKTLGIEKVKLLKYANSGDVTGERKRVVGYGAIIFLSQEQSNNNLSQEEKKELLNIARSSIKYYFEHKKAPEIETKHPFLLKPRGAFVTLRKNGALRGCIGNLVANAPLAETVSKMAIQAAFGDPRFLPLDKDELKDVKIEISVLSPLKKISNPFKEIEIGKHGVVIQQGNRSGVFLPQVATENNWDLETFMNQLCLHKAGIPQDAWKTGQAEIFVFTAEVFSEPR